MVSASFPGTPRFCRAAGGISLTAPDPEREGAMSENNQTNSTGRGGARKNAGRKPGSASKKTRDVANKAAESGLTPLEVMLDNMTFAHTEAHRVLGNLVQVGAEIPDAFDQYKELLRFRGMAQECAKDAAPYIHPKLSAVELTGKDGGGIEVVGRIELVPMRASGSDSPG